MVEEIQKKLQAEIDKFNHVILKDCQKARNKRQLLQGQLTDNINVKKELDLLKEEDEVYKLLGPVLIKQDLEEARENVSRRIEFISDDLKRVEDLITTLDKKQETHREAIDKLQQMFQQAQMKASLSQSKA